MAKVATGHAVCDNEDEGGIFTGWSGMQSPTFESVHEGVIDDAPPPAVQRQPTLASFFGMPTSKSYEVVVLADGTRRQMQSKAETVQIPR